MQNNDKTNSLIAEYNSHREAGVIWKPLWQDCIDIFDTRQITVYDEDISPGERKNQARDRRGALARRNFESGMSSHIAPSSQQWIGYQERREEFIDRDDVKDFWFKTSMIFMQFINDSNFTQVFTQAMGQLAVPGTCMIFMDRGKRSLFNFKTFQIGTYWISEDNEGHINRVYREFKLTVLAASEMWPGMSLGPRLDKILERSKNGLGNDSADVYYRFIHIVRPRTGRKNGARDSLNMPFESFYLNYEDNFLIEEGGYRTFPYSVARGRKIPGETYGRSPAMDALDGAQRLNTITGDRQRYSQMITDPDVIKMFNSPYPVNRGGGKVTLVNDMNDVREWPTQSRYTEGFAFSEEEVKIINEFFYVDLFQLLQTIDKGQMTAYEVGQRMGEKLITIEPLVNNVQYELLQTIAVRGLDIMATAGVLPEIPEDVNLFDFKVIFSNRVSQALQSLQANDMIQGLSFIESVASIDPTFLDNVDFDEFTNALEFLNFPPSAIRSKGDVEEIRQARAQQQQMAQSSELLNKGADTLNKIPEDVRTGIMEGLGRENG